MPCPKDDLRYRAKALAIVENEMHSSEEKHGRLTTDLIRAMLLISEETGELAKAIADYTRAHGGHSRPALLIDITNEAKQVASLATLLIENILLGRVDKTGRI